MNTHLAETPILNYSHPLIQQLIKERKWLILKEEERTKAIYNFVRDEIMFGYNVSDSIKASQVLSDGYGQCNTKSTLLMALLRGCNISNRIHGFTIDKALQKGAINGIWYKLAPANILHSWVEVFVNKKWYYLEGVILDKKYLTKLQELNQDCHTLCGFGVFTDNLQNPPIEWSLNNTYIQDKGINQDFGTFDSPDEFYKTHSQKLNPIKRIIYEKIVRKIMNNTVQKIRKGLS